MKNIGEFGEMPFFTSKQGQNMEIGQNTTFEWPKRAPNVIFPRFRVFGLKICCQFFVSSTEIAIFETPEIPKSAQVLCLDKKNVILSGI